MNDNDVQYAMLVRARAGLLNKTLPPAPARYSRDEKERQRRKAAAQRRALTLARKKRSREGP